MRSDGMISHLVGDRIFTFASESVAIEAAYPWTGRDCLWPMAPDGTLWLLEQGVWRGYNASGWQSWELSPTDDDYVVDYTSGENGILIVATSDTGLYIYLPGQGGNLEPYPQSERYNGSLLYDAQRNSVWVNLSDGIYLDGDVWRYDLVTGEWINFVGDSVGMLPKKEVDGDKFMPIG